jgi:indole-3-glycerol phosphate synthase
MEDYLTKIVNEKRGKYPTFAKSLKQSKLSVIGEIKRKSPSKGVLNIDALPLVETYEKAGVSAISVLTDFNHFGGTLEDLEKVSKRTNLPTLRKDFIVHPRQLSEAILAGATAVLLIAKMLKEELSRFIQLAENLGLETLVEIHDEEDLEQALSAKAPIIGINHRDLKTFQIDLTLSDKLIRKIPDHIITVAESGIQTPQDARRMRELGFDAILVGEALVRSKDPISLIQEMIHAS